MNALSVRPMALQTCTKKKAACMSNTSQNMVLIRHLDMNAYRPSPHGFAFGNQVLEQAVLEHSLWGGTLRMIRECVHLLATISYAEG